jgi:hypothetical protein
MLSLIQNFEQLMLQVLIQAKLVYRAANCWGLSSNSDQN